jgi:hypothetical protein
MEHGVPDTAQTQGPQSLAVGGNTPDSAAGLGNFYLFLHSFHIPWETLINEDFCSLARREDFLSRGIYAIFRALKSLRNKAREPKDH